MTDELVDPASGLSVLPMRPLLRAKGTLYRQVVGILRDTIGSGRLSGRVVTAAKRPVQAVVMLFHSEANAPVELTLGKYRADLFSLTYDVASDQP